MFECGSILGKDAKLAKDSDEIIKEIPQPMDVPQQSNLLIIDTINAKMDPCSEEKIIKIGKFLTNEEWREYSELLHEFPKIFSWIYSENVWHWS